MLQGTSLAGVAPGPADEDFRLFLFEEEEDSPAAPVAGAVEVDDGREDEEVEEVRFFPSSFTGSG